METQVDKILATLSSPANHTEILLKLFHLNRLPENVQHRESIMCSTCLIPWKLGQFNLTVKPSNAKRQTRRNHRIERLQEQLKSKELDKKDAKAISRKLKRLQRQNNHVALYKCLCNKTTKVQLRKKKHTKAASAMIRHQDEKHLEHDNNVKKVKTKKKKNKTAGLLIPPKATMKSEASSYSTRQKNLDKISGLLKQQQNEQQKQSKLNRFFK